MMKKKYLTFILVLSMCLLLSGCGYSKPDTHSLMGLNINSITTVCGTDCELDNIDVNSNKESANATYTYTHVAEDKGITDAGTYHDYLKELDACVKIDEFNPEKGEFCAYLQVTEKIEEGFMIKVSFTKNSYTVHIQDNVNLKEAKSK